jgi:hypothetical protein
MRRALVRSLRRFQIGERSGSRIATDVWHAHDAFLDDDLRHAITRYISEEHRHGDLLEALLGRMGADVSRRDLSASAFTFARRLLGLRGKIIVLNVAEIIGAEFYSSVVQTSNSATVRHVVGAIRDDELAHLAFGLTLIRRMIDAPGSRVRRRVRRIALLSWFYVVLAAAIAVVAVDHTPYLRRAGYASVLRPSLSRAHWFVNALSEPHVRPDLAPAYSAGETITLGSSEPQSDVVNG